MFLAEVALAVGQRGEGDRVQRLVRHDGDVRRLQGCGQWLDKPLVQVAQRPRVRILLVAPLIEILERGSDVAGRGIGSSTTVDSAAVTTNATAWSPNIQ